MSDPFAPDPTTRYPTPPFSPPAHPVTSTQPSPPPAHYTPPIPSQPFMASSRMQSGQSLPPLPAQPSSRRSTPPTALDEFGYAAGTSSSSPRARPSHSPGATLPLPVPSSSVSADHHSTAATQGYGGRQRNRQSHNPSSTLDGGSSPPKPEYLTDEYVLHPSVWAYKQAHPRRPVVGFGAYVLLQTLGEGEFGKVKLGVHTEYGVEVAIKLIRRGSLEDEVRASKVEREIDVLRALKHPNIVRMFDVMETDKYIGIVLEFAGGGELFDHILANRYLKEKDAQKLFAQLISGVDYLHKKHIVHRDLKLENLLLDKHRNIIITDFGFANRFDHEQDDLMATSCGSPCYAAPELVVSEGLYVGSAVDIWSCGVILYAMLSGYLPYDDDPANPDGDNINLLYKYIMSTKLNFPDHTSAEAKHLLQIMLVPNPEYRCRIEQIMKHPWLANYRDLFSRTVDDQEYIFHENMYRKSEQARRELQARRQVQQEAKMAKTGFVRSQSSLPGSAGTASMLNQARRQREARHHSALPGTTTMPEHLNSGGRKPPPFISRQTMPVPPPVPAMAQTSPVIADSAVLVSPNTFPSRPSPTDRPSTPKATPPRQRSESMAPAISQGGIERSSPDGTANEVVKNESMDVDARETTTPPSAPGATPPRAPMSANKNRHTIQVEYDGEASYERMKEVLEAKRAAATGASVPRIPPVPALPTSSTSRSGLVGLAPTSDIEMESGSSDMGHTQEGTLESFAAAASGRATPEASQVLTPPATTPPPAVALESSADGSLEARASPVTPLKKGEKPMAASTPSTPRAAKTTDDAVTPRAQPRNPSDATLPPPRSGGKRFESMPAPRRKTALPALGAIPLPPNPDLGPIGLPKVPPSKRERTRKGMSLDKFGLAKLLGQTQASSSVDVSKPPPSAASAAISLQEAQNAALTKAKRASMVRPRTADTENKKSRRRTLQLMVNRSTSIRNKSNVSTPTTAVTPLTARDMNPTISTPQTSVSGKGPSAMVIDSEGIQPTPTSDRGQSSPSVVTVDAFAAQQASPAGHKTASSSAAKKVMDWFRRKSLAMDTLVSLKTAGIKSDSASSFVNVSDSPIRRTAAAHMGDHTSTNLPAAMNSTNSVLPIPENQNAVVVDATPESTAPQDRPAVEQQQVAKTKAKVASVGSPNRVPLASAANKTNIVPPSSGNTSSDLLSPGRGTSVPFPIPTRSKSLVPEHGATQTNPPGVPLSATSTIAPIKVPLRDAPAPRADESKMRVHTGLVDQSALSSKPPKDVITEAIKVLQEMGMEIKKENEFRLRCTRVRRKKSGATTGLGLGSVMSVGSGMSPFALMSSASTGGKTDSRGLPMPSSPSAGILSSASSLKGMLLRRGSSYSSTHPTTMARSESDVIGSPSASSIGLGSPCVSGTPTLHEPLYGEHSVDSGDEVKFVVELCRIKNLPGLYLLNIKRLRGSVWSFKFIYQTVLERCKTLTH